MRRASAGRRVRRREDAYRGLRCVSCQRFFTNDRVSRCTRCGGLLDTVFDEEVLANYSRSKLENGQGSMWRYRKFLPVRRSMRPLSAGEGDTPLLRVRMYPGRVMVKDETRNPTGSFKDRGASLALTRLSQLGVRSLVLASEGNAGCSFALYSRMAGVRCRVYLPREVNPAKVELSQKLGATVTRVSGTIAQAGREAAKSADRTRSYNASTFVTPFRHDGKGTMASEICQQLGWNAPDSIIYPLGGGVGLVGMWKMFKLLERLGWVRGKPRIVAVQPYGCAPIVDAYNAGREDVEEWKSPQTIALGLKIPKPLAGKWILQSLRESDGIGVKVADREIRTAMRNVARKEGLLIEPSSAAAFAAVPHVYDTGSIDRKDTVVVIATGSGLKTLEQF